MKKLITAVLALLILLTAAGCSAKMDDVGGLVPPHAPNGENVEPSDDIPSSGMQIENPFVPVSEQPVSTFSADVDTASYTYFRKLCSLGYTLPDLIATAGNSIRTEEMINYFRYDGTDPKEGELFGVKTVISACPWNPEASLMTLTLKTKPAVNRQKNNLVFLIDVSGSMGSSDKLGLLKTAFGYLIDALSEDDIVSIVTYSGREAVVLEGCPGSRAEQIRNAVDSLESGGSTNGQAGIRTAYEIAEKYLIPDGNNRIIMASDGDLNVGISSPEELKQYIEQKRQNNIYLSTLGFGFGNYRDSAMEAIADNGNGVYYYIDSETEAEKIFGTDLLSTLYTVASDVKLQLTFRPEVVEQYRLIGYENRLLTEEDFADDTKDAGEIGAGHAVTVCYELILTDKAASSEEWMKLAIRHKNPGEDKSNLNEYTIGNQSLTDAPDDDFLFITAVAEFSMILRKSEYLKTDSSVEGILARLTALPSPDEYRAQFITLLQGLIKKG